MLNMGFFKGWLGRFKLVRRYMARKLEPGSNDSLAGLTQHVSLSNSSR
jgi:hypothetical protein